MKMGITRMLVLVCAFAALASCSSGDGPSKAEMQESLVDILPEFVSVTKLDIEETEKTGDEANPLYKSQFRAELRLTTDTYTVAGRDGDILIVQMKAKQGDVVEVFGNAESTVEGDDWRVIPRLKGPAVANLGQPLDSFTGQAARIMVAGSDEETAYRAEKERLRALEPDYVTVQHILIAFAGTIPGKGVTRTKEAAQQLANSILKQAQAGEDFDAMVKEYTDDSYPGIYKMANKGIAADMSQQIFSRERMVTGFGDVGFSLKVGEVGMASYDAANSKYGWHIIKRVE